MNRDTVKTFLDEFKEKIDKNSLRKMCLMGGIEHYLVSQFSIMNDRIVSEAFNRIDMILFKEFVFHDERRRKKVDWSNSSIDELFEVKCNAHRDKVSEYPSPYGPLKKFCSDTCHTILVIFDKFREIIQNGDMDSLAKSQRAFNKDIRHRFKGLDDFRVLCLMFNTFYSTDYREMLEVVESGRGGVYTRYDPYLSVETPRGGAFHWVEPIFREMMNSLRTNSRLDIDFENGKRLDFEEWYNGDILGSDVATISKGDQDFFVGCSVHCWNFFLRPERYEFPMGRYLLGKDEN